jgi:hypothetical protein
VPSPFPGIDPYLESQGLWPDFHVRFITALGDAINEQLPEPYVARIDERMYLVERLQEEIKQIRPDVAVVRERPLGSVAEPSSGTLTLEPVTIPLKFLDEYREVFIEILHRPEDTLVAVVELLSPGNKAGTTRRDYLAKRNSLMTRDVHLIELDFLVGGQRLPMEQPLPAGDYYALVARAERRPDCDVFVWTVRDPLPTIPVPLLPPDPDLRIGLGPLFASVYERARYARSLRYRERLTVPLAPEDRSWAEELAQSLAAR